MFHVKFTGRWSYLLFTNKNHDCLEFEYLMRLKFVWQVPAWAEGNTLAELPEKRMYYIFKVNTLVSDVASRVNVYKKLVSALVLMNRLC